MSITEHRQVREDIPGLLALLDAGHEVTFLPGDNADEGRTYECHIITPDGNGVTACGATPAAALAEASPLAPADGRGLTAADRLDALEGRLDALAANTVRADALKELLAAFWEDGRKHGLARITQRLDALEVRAEELEGR